MPDIKLATLDSIGFWAMIVGACFGAVALAASSLSAYMLYRASNLAQDEANEKIKTLDVQLAEARERTEELRAKNLAMEKWIAPRELTPPQIEALSALKNTPVVQGAEIGVVAVHGDIESYRFAVQLAGVLAASGLRASPSASSASLATPFFVGLSLTVQRGQEAIGQVLREALNRAELSPASEPPQAFQPSNATRIYVGLKPRYSP